jgi:hypothetical protein
MAFGDIVQSGEDDAGDSNSTSVSVTLGSTPTEGNLLVACHTTGATGSTGPSGWSEAFALTFADDEGALYYKIAGVAESSTVTCTSSQNKSNGLYVVEFEGSWNATPLDVTATNGPTGSPSTLSTGTTAATAQNDEVAVAQFSIDGVRTVTSWTNSFSERADLTAQFKSLAVATKVLTSTGTVETTATFSSSPFEAYGGIATFKKAAAGAADSITPLQRQIRARRLPHWRM